jgi:1-phosphofructokinase
VNRISSVREDAGGKGVNVSKCLKKLGADTVAVMILAGVTGKRLSTMLEDMKIPMLRMGAEGENRTNLKIIDPVNHSNTDINEPGPKIDEDLLENLKEKMGKSVHKGDIVVLSGSLPKGVNKGLYARWTKYFQYRGVHVFLDADGEAMEKGIRAVPYMIKPNNDELAALLGKEKLTLEEMVAEGKRLVDTGIEEVVISLGSDGVLFVSKDGCYKADALTVPVKSTVGAGDSVVAAMAYGKVKNLSREEKIRLAVAIGAASVMQDGSQPPESALVWELAKRVQIQKL